MSGGIARFRHFCLLIASLMMFALRGAGQSVRYLQWMDEANAHVVAQSFTDSMAAMQYLYQLLSEDRKNGYLAANIDAIRLQGDTLQINYYKGARYKLGKIGLDSIPKTILNQVGIAENQLHDRTLSPRYIASLMDKIIRYAENNGFPFAELRIEDARLEHDSVFYGHLRYYPGSKVLIDSIHIRGDVELNYAFILAYLGLKNRMPYNESALQGISKKLRALNFVSEAAPWHMDFTVYTNNLYIYLKERKSNQINALVGFQPNNNETNRFLWTADVQLVLNNTLGFGEHFAASYKNLQRNSPHLTVTGMLPYIMGSKWAVDANFEYYKRDSLFDKVGVELGLRYQLSENDYIRLDVQQQSNRVPSPDTAYVRAQKRLPALADIRSRGFGFTYAIDRTDYKFNPSRGWQSAANLTMLNRKVLQSNAILSLNDGFNYQALYDTANANPLQYRASLTAAYFLPLAKAISLELGYKAAFIEGKGLYQNELYQIGGIKVLRGYDDRSIFSHQYHIGTLGTKVLLNTNSFFNIFTDYGVVHSRHNQESKRWRPWSFGAGITLENNTGVINFIVAMGKMEHEPFRFRDAKVHFGYLTYF